MPRSSGGGRGSFSSRGSNPNVKRNAAATVASNSIADTIKHLTSDSSSCQVVFDIYEECILTEHLYGARSCEFARELKEKCISFERDPRRESVFEGQRKWRESTQRAAAAAGFDDMFDYIEDQLSKDREFCRLSYERYKECISREPNSRVCDTIRNKCKEYMS